MRAPYSRDTSSSLVNTASRAPLVRNIDFTAGDEVRYRFLFKGKVWTAHRPEDADGLPMFAEGETIPDGVTASPTVLLAPWERRYWFSQVRDSYVSSVRYYNGWVPWYGMRPDWVWWKSASLAGTFTCGSSYSAENEGTIVEIVLSDVQSKDIKPHKKYRWDLESVEVKSIDENGDPTAYKGTRTWVGGRCTVYPEWTI